MPSWIKIEVKDTAKSPADKQRQSRAPQDLSSLRWLLWAGLGLIMLVVAFGVGIFLRNRASGGKVVAYVNGQPIMESELAAEKTLFLTMSALTQGRAPEDIPTDFDMLNRIIADRLKYQAASSAGYNPSMTDAEAQITPILSQVGITDAQLNTALSQSGLTRADLQEWIRRQLAINVYVNNVVTASVPEEVQEAAVRNWSNTLQSQADVEIRLGTTGAQRAAKVGEPAPDFALPTPDGDTVRLSNLRGQPILVNFWATWCPPCKQEMPDIEVLYQKYKDQGFTVIAVDQQESPDAVQKYFDDLNLTFQPVIDSTGEVFNYYRVVALPTSYFIDADGVVRFQHRGLMTAEQMENYAAQLMSQ
jgi:cytochrome c biogenesis protein CcmG/thiol:disulfide interchange protein DsbE